MEDICPPGSAVLCYGVLCYGVLYSALPFCSIVCALPFVLSRAALSYFLLPRSVLSYSALLYCAIPFRGYLFWHGFRPSYGHDPILVYDLLNNFSLSPPGGGKEIGFPTVGMGKGKTFAPPAVLYCATD